MAATGPPPSKKDYNAEVAEARFDKIIKQLRSLQLFEKLQKTDRLHLITRNEVVELYQILDQNNSGEITREDLLILASIPGSRFTADHVDHIMEDCDRDGNGVISVDELYKAVTQGALAFNAVLEEITGKKGDRLADECNRDALLRYMTYQFNKDDACFSLPFTLLFFTVFLLLIQIHLEIPKTYDVHAGLENEISGEGGRSNHEGPFLQRDVHDIPTFWDWYHASFVSGVFKSTRDFVKADFPIPGRVASFNQIIGAVGLEKTDVRNDVCAQSDWLLLLYDSTGTQAAKKPCQPPGNSEEKTTVWFPYQVQKQALADKIKKLWDTQWLNRNNVFINVKILFYNAHYGLYTDLQIGFEWQRQGLYIIKYSMTSFEAAPYSQGWKVIIDLIYLGLILKMLYGESKELIPAIKNGIDGFFDYWEFWNGVDWLSISTGFLLLGFWISTIGQIGGDLAEKLKNIPSQSKDGVAGLDAFIVQDKNYLTYEEFYANTSMSEEQFADQMKALHADVESIVNSYNMFRMLIACYILVMMLRFFKSFRANPRLNVVTQTIVDGSVDIGHFLVVFMTIFVAFVLCAQVLFGSRMKDFSTLLRAFNMSFRILMGEFDFEAMTSGSSFDYIVGMLWFWFFECLVFLILFNMLLAIVMDTYSSVSGKKEGSETMIEQTFSTYRLLQQTRGHLNLWYLICEFEDDDDPAHPEKVITIRSLRRSFPKMTKHNAEFLITSTNEYLQASESTEDSLTISSAMKLITKQLQISRRTSEQMEFVYAETVLLRSQRINAGLGNALGAPGMMAGQQNNMMIMQQQQQQNMMQMSNKTQEDNAPDKKSKQRFDEMSTSELFDYMRDRNQWMDQRFSEMDRRAERIDRNTAAMTEKMLTTGLGGGGGGGDVNVGSRRTSKNKIAVSPEHGSIDWRRLKKIEDSLDKLEMGQERILELLERQQFQRYAQHQVSP